MEQCEFFFFFFFAFFLSFLFFSSSSSNFDFLKSIILGSKLLINKYKIRARFYLPEPQHGLNKAIGTDDKLTMWEWSVLAL
jgi:hypothetical protein